MACITIIYHLKVIQGDYRVAIFGNMYYNIHLLKWDTFNFGFHFQCLGFIFLFQKVNISLK
jgi:hypothetical protein